MATRAIGSATISFGLVAIPIKIFSASQSAGIHFNWLHKKCGTRLKQQYVCPYDQEVVERDDMIKGYEFAKGQYVTFEPEELKALAEPSTQSIEITEFIPQEQVPTLYYDKPYFLGPDKGASRPYRLLSQALHKTERAALGRHAARGKQYLVLIVPHGEGLVLYQLHHHGELRQFEEVPIGEAAPKPAEVHLAVQLIEQSATESFNPERYRDDVQERVEQAIEQKLEGKEIVAPEAEEPKAKIIDLMEALKASIGAQAQASSSGSKAKAVKVAARKPPKRANDTSAAPKKAKKRASR